MDKTFYITYYASKHKKHITRQGKHDEKSRYGVAKNVIMECEINTFVVKVVKVIGYQYTWKVLNKVDRLSL
jgi:hypothetical protein